MAWSVEFDGVSNYAEFDTPTTFHQGLLYFRFESKFIIGSGTSTSIYFVIRSGTGNGYISLRPDNTFRVRYNNTTFEWTGIPFQNDGSTEVNLTVVRDDDTIELFIDDVSYGSKSISVGGTTLLTQIGGITGLFSKFFLLKQTLWDNVDGTGTPLNDWDADLSDHNSTTLTDFGSLANNAQFAGGMTTANWIDQGGGGIVEDAATDLTLADGSIDSVSISESAPTNTLLVDSSLDLLSITEDVTTNVSLVDASIDSISLNESSKTELTLVDNSTDTASGSIVESAVTVMLVVDNSADSISISDSGVTELTLVDGSTDEVASGVVSSEVTELTLVDVSSDSIGLTESAPVELTLVDNSIDSVSKESIDSGVIILASLTDAEITATLTEIEIRAYL